MLPCPRRVAVRRIRIPGMRLKRVHRSRGGPSTHFCRQAEAGRFSCSLLSSELWIRMSRPVGPTLRIRS